jgi:hypothetical protein
VFAGNSCFPFLCAFLKYLVGQIFYSPSDYGLGPESVQSLQDSKHGERFGGFQCCSSAGVVIDELAALLSGFDESNRLRAKAMHCFKLSAEQGGAEWVMFRIVSIILLCSKVT